MNPIHTFITQAGTAPTNTERHQMGSIGTTPSTGGHAFRGTFMLQLCSGLAPRPGAHNFKHKHSAHCQLLFLFLLLQCHFERCLALVTS